jgi:hypothetical protein
VSWNTTLESVEYQRHDAKSEAWPTVTVNRMTWNLDRIGAQKILKNGYLETSECASGQPRARLKNRANASPKAAPLAGRTDTSAVPNPSPAIDRASH